MHSVLIYAIFSVFGVFTGLALIIIISKMFREAVGAYRRRRRKVLEPLLLAYAHGTEESFLPVLGGRPRLGDRTVIETVLLDHIQRVRGIEKLRIGKALTDLGFVDRNLEKLRSTRWWRRAEGAEKLGLAGDRQAIERLVSTLRDQVPEVRIRAAKALGAVGGKASALPLIEALKEPNRWSTIRVADILAGMGREVVDELMGAFGTMALPARLATLDIFGRIRPLEAVPWLEERLGDDEPDVRARACNALGSIGEPGSGLILTQTLGDPEWPVRAMAAKALGKLQDRNAIDPLCNALRDREWWVRANAAEALRLIGPEGIKALDGMVEDQDTYACHQAVLMLEEAGEVDRYVDLLEEADDAVRLPAEDWIARLVRVGQIGRLCELAVQHGDELVRVRLAALLSEPVEDTPGKYEEEQ